MFIALSVMAVAALSDSFLRDAFPDFNDVLQYRSQIINGDYRPLATHRFDSCEVLVFDEKGNALYASSTDFAQAIRLSDLEFIGDRSSPSHYLVMEDEYEGRSAYRVLRLVANADSGFERCAAECYLDKNLNIVAGTLFAPRTHLTYREFYLLLGIYEWSGREDEWAASHDEVASEVTDSDAPSAILKNDQYVIERYSEMNDAGEFRTIVFASPTIDSYRLNMVTQQAQAIWFVLIPVVGAATVVLFFLESRLIRNATNPLSQAIAGYADKGEVDIDARRVSVELRPMLDSFKELTETLERSQADKRRMIADVSHDVKTPLTVIRGYAQAFRDGMVPPGKEGFYANALCEKAEVAARMVESLAEYAAMEHPEYQARLVSCDFGGEILGICASLQSYVEQQADTLSWDIDDASMPACIDRELLRRLITNLVGNACVHNDAGTSIAVTCRRAADERGVAQAIVTVSDNGCGISPELSKQVFNEFVTKNEARTSGEGTGLGLAIARRCAELNGGTIHLVEHPDAPWSTQFVLTLPLDA